MKTFKTADFNYQVLRSLGKCTGNFAEVGDCLAVAERIEDGDIQSWHRQWIELANTLHDQAVKCKEDGHYISARNLFFRASEYYRQASFFHRVDLDCTELQTAIKGHVDSFNGGCELLPYTYEQIRIPFEEKHMFGYMFFQDQSGKPRPAVIAPNGYDSTAEEMMVNIGLPALERGYNVLLFDAPGQERTLYDKDVRLFMRPDFEVPFKAVVDYALSRPDFQQDKIAVYGASFGGYLVPRGASEEHRISALVADPGQHDIGSGALNLLPEPLRAKLHDDSLETEEMFQKLVSTPAGELKFLPRMAAHGVTSLRKYILLLQDYHTTPEQLGKISCPCLICDNEEDTISTLQGEELAEHLSGEYEFVRFTIAEGAGGHCQPLGKQIFFQRVFDWLDEKLDVR